MDKLKQYLKSVYKSIKRRRDSYLELGLSLASSKHLESVVALSKNALYKRSFSSVYETLDEVSMDGLALLTANHHLGDSVCANLEEIAIYSGDSTFIKRPDAKTLEARVMKRLANGELAYGYETYWSMRLASEAKSWAAAIKVERMLTNETVTDKAKTHIQEIDALATKAQLYVMDAGHGKGVLATYPECRHTDIIMRVKSNQLFYFDPKAQKRLGRPRKHGDKFKLDNKTSQPEPKSLDSIDYKDKQLRIQAWPQLHYQSYPHIKGRILKLEFLDDEGKTIFDKPIWLFTTNTKLSPQVIARAYLWRSSHELSFRFMKQHLGLKLAKSPEAIHCDNWFTLVAIAMNILLAAKEHLEVIPDPWYPKQSYKAISQRQAQKQALSFFLNLTTPMQNSQPAGKGKGRREGFYPKPRIRHPVIRKTPKSSKHCKSCACFIT